MKRLKRLAARGGAVLFVAVTVVSLSWPGDAGAAWSQSQRCANPAVTLLGRPGCVGYYNNKNYYDNNAKPAPGLPGWDVLVNPTGDTSNGDRFVGVVNALTFENLMKGYLNGTIAGTGSQYNAIGAAFIIEAMLGVPGGAVCGKPTSGSCSPAQGIAYAKTHFAEWTTRVDYYANNGMVSWDPGDTTNYTLKAGTMDSAHQCRSDTKLISAIDCNNKESLDYQDIAFRRNIDTTHAPLIIFSNSDGTTFRIRRDCGNVIGDQMGPLTIFTPACGSFNPPTGPIQPGQTFTFSVSDTYTSGPPPPGLYFHIDASPFYVNHSASPVVNDTTSTPHSLTYTTSSVTAPPGTGAYPFSWQLYVDIGGVPTALGPSCPATLNVVNAPYFSVFGGDVEAGGGFQLPSGGCPAAGSGVIAGWYDSQAAAEVGANTLFSAIALGQITGFASAQARAGPSPNPHPTGLTFANSGVGPPDGYSPKLGGMYGASSCFYTPMPPTGGSTTTETAGTATISAIPLSNGGAYHYTNPVTLSGGTIAVGSNDNLSMFVDGNVYITSNITYAPGGWGVTPGSPGNVPSFILKATGNIYIDPSVTQLDGIYIAQKNPITGAPGTIYTCGISTSAAVLASNIYATCKQQLTVHGSFIANQVNLMRAYGTLRDATANENPTQGPRLCHGAGGTPNEPVCAGEVFDFSPEMYLSNPAIQPASNGAPQYDAITSLPPVL